MLSTWKRRMYRGGRPDRTAAAMNRLSAWWFRSGVLARDNWIELEVRGRTSGRRVTFPLVVAEVGGERYLVSMLGEANWVRNVRADGGRAVLRHGTAVPVLLEEVPAAERPPIIKRYLALAPGARPHIPVDRSAPAADFAPVAAGHPVFRIRPRG
ncbi:nitroreductase/quinone reductase family protein [Nocardiopsis coralliicola]